MNIDQFNFDLPGHLVAQEPLPNRSDSRLLHVRSDGGFFDKSFNLLPPLLRAGDLLVFNDTRVIPARCVGKKAGTGGHIELLLERILDENTAVVQIGTSKRVRDGLVFQIGDVNGTVLSREDGFFRVCFDSPAASVFEKFGHMPLPPYIRRVDEKSDRDRYQTVYARSPGAVAAPTAGLHFDNDLLQRIDQTGIERISLTLHVGAGTFQPIRTEVIEQHRMHSERYVISGELCAAVNRTRSNGGRIVAVGTTVARALESASDEHGRLVCGSAETRIFIYPGYKFRQVDGLITNFHLPKSSLLLLVSAFAGQDRIKRAYSHAIEQSYRFYSYGDAMLLEPGQ